MSAILEALSESRYGLTIGAGLVVLLLLLIYALVSMRGKNKKGQKKKATPEGGTAAPLGGTGGIGTTGDGGVKYYKDGPPMPQDNDSGEYRDSDLYGTKGDKKDKEQFYKDWD